MPRGSTGDVRVTVGAEVSQLRRGMNEAGAVVKDFTQSSQRGAGTVRALSGAMDSLSGVSGNAGRAIGVFGGVLQGLATGGLMGAAFAAVGGLVQVFRDVGSESEEAARKAEEAAKRIATRYGDLHEEIAKIKAVQGMSPAQAAAYLEERKHLELVGAETTKLAEAKRQLADAEGKLSAAQASSAAEAQRVAGSDSEFARKRREGLADRLKPYEEEVAARRRSVEEAQAEVEAARRVVKERGQLAAGEVEGQNKITQAKEDDALAARAQASAIREAAAAEAAFADQARLAQRAIAQLNSAQDKAQQDVIEEAQKEEKAKADQAEMANKVISKQLAEEQNAAQQRIAMQQQVGDQLGTMMGNLITGQQTFGQVMAQVGQMVIQQVVKMAIANVTSHAAGAAAGAAESQASIPYVGPVLAIAAMGAMLTAVMGLLGNIGGAADGAYLPSFSGGRLGVLHRDEMVTTAGDTAIWKEIKRRVIGGGGGGGATLNVNVTTPDAKSFGGMLTGNHRGLRDASRRLAKLGRL